MHLYRAIAIIIATLGCSSPALAGCWPSESFPIVCWLDTYGLACEQHRTLTTAEAYTVQWPRASTYKFAFVDTWTAASEVACPATKTTTVIASWDRETGKAEEWEQTSGAYRYVYCNRSPWTGQGPNTPTLCSGPAGDPQAKLPVTPYLLSDAQKNGLLYIDEPTHTSCQITEPTSAFGIPTTVNSIVEVAVAHHEFQNIQWHVFWQDNEITPPHLPGPDLTQTEYTERRIATTRRSFRLNKPGQWRIVATATPSFQLVQFAWSIDCTVLFVAN